MKWFKVIFAVALSAILVVSALSALFGAGRMLNAGLQTYVFQIEECRYDYPRPIPVEPDGNVLPQEPQETCFIDHNRAKREIAGGLSMFIPGVLVATLTLVFTRKIAQRE